MSDSQRERRLQTQLRAAAKVIEALIERAERHHDDPVDTDQIAVRKAIASLQDVIAERTRALRASDALYRSLFDHCPDPIFTVDAKGIVTAQNGTARELFGASLVGQRLCEQFVSDSRDGVTSALCQRVASDQELTLTNDRGTVLVTAASVPGYPEVAQVVLRDITTRVALERKLQHAQRLAAIGHLAAGVAHEINNPLTVCQLKLEVALERDLHRPDRLRDHLGTVRHHTERIARIVQNLHAFARPTLAAESVQVATLVAEALEVAGHRLTSIDITVDVPAQLVVLADPGQVDQVLVNLISNAAQAMAGRGSLHISAWPEGGDRVCVRVDDTGPGLPEARIDELFTPFVSGRPGGTGLGLAISWGIVQEHGGLLRASNHDHGARFEFTLPRAEDAPMPSIEAPLQPDSVRACRILVIDDEPALVALIDDLASLAGHSVLGVGSAEEALKQLNGCDLVLSDVRLPGISGPLLAEKIAILHPELPVVLMSGTFYDDPHHRYLQKPFSRHDLLALIEEFAPTPTHPPDDEA